MPSFTFNCPKCGTPIEADDEWRGQQAQCPDCNETITIPKPAISPDTPKTDEKYCPFCGKIIKKQASLCRYCKARLTEGVKQNYVCPQCCEEFQTTEDNDGKKMECPICGQIIAISLKSKSDRLGGLPLAENASNSASNEDNAAFEKHLAYASLALKSGSYAEAEKEFQKALAIKDDSYAAIYGEMLSHALQTSWSHPCLDKIIFGYNKIMRVLEVTSASQEQRLQGKLRFIGEFSGIFISEYNSVIQKLYENKNAAELRDAVNTLNALNRGIVLSNPEAQQSKEEGNILFPYLGEILKSIFFIMSLIDVSEIDHDPELLDLCGKICEITQDSNEDGRKKFEQIQNAQKELNIQTLMETRGMSRGDAAKAASLCGQSGNIQDQLRDLRMNYYFGWMLFVVFCVVIIGTLPLVLWAWTSNQCPIGLKLFFTAIPLMFIGANIYIGRWLHKSHKKAQMLKISVAEAIEYEKISPLINANNERRPLPIEKIIFGGMSILIMILMSMIGFKPFAAFVGGVLNSFVIWVFYRLYRVATRS